MTDLINKETPEPIVAELQKRIAIWRALRSDPLTDFHPKKLRDLGVYGGAQGVWVDKKRTEGIAEEGVTVGILHTGRHYPDDLSHDGMIYHYPKTSRPAARDAAEVQATKNAGDLQLPIFVILPGDHSHTRSLKLGWVADSDDEAGQFLILFGEDQQPKYEKPAPTESPFSLVAADDRRASVAKTRPGQQRFRFQVLKEYGAKCAVCQIKHPTLLVAAHICGKGEKGSDDWRNGLPFCATHHAAFDAHLFAILPETGRLSFPTKVDPHAIGIEVMALNTERGHPHIEALKWRWNVTQRQWNDGSGA